MKFRNFCLLFLSLASLGSFANPINTGNLEARLMSVPTQIAPGETFTLLLEHQIRPDWHTYWVNPGDSGAPIKLTWREPAGFTFSDVGWPYPERIPYGPLMNYGYHDRVVYPIEVTAPELISGDTVTFDMKGEWLVCADVCIPERGELQLTVSVGNELILDPEMVAEEAAARQRIPQYVSIPATVDATADDIKLAISMPNLEADRVRSVFYFPFLEALIDNPVEQRFSISEKGIEISLKPGYDYVAGASFDGIVVIEEEVGETRTTAFEIRPDAGVLVGSGSEAGLSLVTALFFAFVGGLILNLMPCVFPVLSIKILSLMGETSDLKSHGWLYVAGVVLSFVSIAMLLIALRAGGAEIGWGFQLQSPWVVGLLVYLFLLVGLNLSGYFEVGTSLMSLGGGSALTHSGKSGSFFTGVLATLVAAPCTAPFMASAIGYALTQSNVAALLIFTSLGLGMAAPYLALCYSPGLIKKLPKPGAWMERLKEILAFPLYASAVWLLWVLSLQTGATGVLLVGAGAVLLTFAIWLLKHLPRTSLLRLVQQASALVLVLGVIVSPFQLQTVSAQVAVSEDGSESVGERNYESYSTEKLAAYRSEGAVFVNFTAAWCVTCKVNEAVALSTPEVEAVFAENGIRYLKGDWTNEDPEITRKLAEHGRSGVPLYLYYEVGAGKPVVLPQLLTKDIVLRAVQNL
jgi:thiol:disulfide interchange protein/DsbC/DsbD-like thiol-disulfide interchange protein